MKRTILSVALGVLGIASVAMADTQITPAEAQTKNPVLFVQTAKAATLVADGQAAGAYTLTLADVNPQVVWFTDRPGRAAGTVGMKKFVAAWGNTHEKDSFKLDHPNAALVSVTTEQDDSGKKVAPVFTLSQPNYNRAQHQMTYHAVLVNGSGKVLAPNLKDVAILVDDSVPPDGAWLPLGGL